MVHSIIRRRVLALLAGGAATTLPGCGVAGDRLPDYRYRLTVEVETPEGLKTGSSVIEVRTAIAGRNSIPTPGAVSNRPRGEAVTVNLGTRGVLFALLCTDIDYDWASNVMFRIIAPKIRRQHNTNGKFDAARDFKVQFAAMLKHRELIELPRTFPEVGHLRDQPARPMLVRFHNLADPKTIERVDPDDLAAFFGPGVVLKRITVQLTDDPVTTGIEKRLVWLPKQKGSFIPLTRDMPIDNRPFGYYITEGNFRRGYM